jgi:hypothetical protein
MTDSIEFIVQPSPDKKRHLEVRWPDGKIFWTYVPEVFLDLMPFAIARWLLDLGYDLKCLLIVHLHFPEWGGGDREAMRAPLGTLAATPLVNGAPLDEYPPWHFSHYPAKRETLQ